MNNFAANVFLIAMSDIAVIAFVKFQKEKDDEK
jgi:hypothetical protein